MENYSKAGYSVIKSSCYGTLYRPYVVVTPNGLLSHEDGHGRDQVTKFASISAAEAKIEKLIKK